MSNDRNIDVKVTATTTGLTDGMSHATESIREFSEQSAGHVKGLTDAITNIQAPVEALSSGLGGLWGAIAGGAIAEGIEKIAEGIEKIAEGAKELYEYGVEKPLEMAESWEKLGYQMGLTSGQAQQYEAAAKLSGTSQEQLSQWVNLATRSIKSNSEALKGQGDSALTAAVKSGDFGQYLQAVSAHAAQMADPIQRGEFLTLALGRSGAQGGAQLERFASALSGAGDAAQEFGYNLGVKDIENMKDFQKARGQLQLGLEGLELTLGRALIPAFSQLMQIMGQTGVFQLLQTEIVGTAIFLNDWTQDIYESEEEFITFVKILGAGGQAIIQGSMALQSLDFGGAKKAYEDFAEYGTNQLGSLNEAMKSSRAETDAYDRKMIESLTAASKVESLGPQGGDKKYVDPKAAEAAKKAAAEREAALEAEYRLELQEAEKGSQERIDIVQREMERIGDLFGTNSVKYSNMQREMLQVKKDYSAAQLAATQQEFKTELSAAEKGSQDKLQIAEREVLYMAQVYGLNSKAYASAQKELLAVTKEVNAEQVKEAMSAAEIIVKTEEKSVTAREKLLKDQAQQHTISSAEELAGLTKLENERYSVITTEINKELALQNISSQQIRELQTKQAAESEKHADQLVAINEQATNQMTNQWMRFFTPLGGQFQTMFGNWLAGTGKFDLSWSTVMSSMRQSAAKVVSEMTTEWLEGEAKKTIATLVQNETRQGIEEQSALTSVALAVWTGIKWVAIQAYQAAAGAYNAIVSIPYVGPVLAPIAAGVALAGVLALGSKISSAEGGYDIPRGINPVVQLHEEEMVLPKEQARAVRKMADSGGGSGGGTEFHYHNHVHAIDAQGVSDFLDQHGEAMAREGHRQWNNFVRRS